MKKADVAVESPFMFNPFEILNLEKSYSIDLNLLEKHYFEAQKKNHPDRFSQASPQVKAEALRNSIHINQAYLVLKNPLLRAEYLLKEAEVPLLSSDPTFLAHVMMWNERTENGEDLEAELLQMEQCLLVALGRAFKEQDYEKAQSAHYQLTYVQKLLKDRK